MDYYPKMLYKAPGPEFLQGFKQGVTYCVVSDAAQEEAAEMDGWKGTVEQAIEAGQVKPHEPPPTRAEMELKAKELGLTFDGRTSDAKLLKAIADKLAAP